MCIRDRYTFEKVKNFVYLGYQVNSNGETTDEIKRRIPSANRCFFVLRSLFQSRTSCFCIKHWSAQFSLTVLKPGPFLESLRQACWFMNATSSAAFLVQYVWEVNGGKGPAKNWTLFWINQILWKLLNLVDSGGLDMWSEWGRMKYQERHSPVSYTHLDVYKRQHTYWTKNKLYVRN